MLTCTLDAIRNATPVPMRRLLDPAIDRVPALARHRDTLSLRHRMQEALGYNPDLQHPRTYNEKIAWKMLFDRNPLIPLTADKLAVRNYIASKVGTHILVPLIGQYRSTSEIEWDRLPDSFVIKASHGSGMTIMVSCKAQVGRAAILLEAESWLRRNYYHHSRGWGHRNIPRRILVERRLGGADGGIPEDYKFYVFHGWPRILEVHLDRFGQHRALTYDPTNLTPLPFRSRAIGLWQHETDFAPAAGAREMTALAARLGEDFDHVRVDLYWAEGRAWFGELTHYSGNACDPFDPPGYDRIVGDMWPLAA